MHEPGSLANLELALHQVRLRLEDVRLVACTHAHADHYGQAAPIVERAGCELWMHPNHEHAMRPLRDPEDAVTRRIEIARQSGVSEAALEHYAELVKEMPSGIAAWHEPDRALVPGVEIETDLGTWTVHETPGHAPSHVCLFQQERRILISGDHLLGRVSLYYDYGWSPDPVGEFLRSLDVVQALDARLCVAGHARPFTDVGAHIDANRKLVHERLHAVAAALDGEPRTVVEIVPEVYGEPLTELNAGWRLSETLCYLRHLEVQGSVRRERVSAEEAERWRRG
jgi:glyoxylase-like metal-dependent hydrolase (beta-lactamase superfamily II)